MLCESFKEQTPVPLFLTPNVETNLRALPIPDSFKSPCFKYFRQLGNKQMIFCFFLLHSLFLKHASGCFFVPPEVGGMDPQKAGVGQKISP